MSAGRGTAAWAVLFFGALFAILFAPVLAGDATIVHGDALSVGLPLQHLLASSLARGELPLWSDALYAGHPIFAEGQGGFAHPVNLLLFGFAPRLFGTTTLYAHGLLPALCGWIAALGTYCLCRALGCGRAASLLGGAALGCSQGWLALAHNPAIGHSLAWVPLALCALERWWRAPGVDRAVVLAASVALVALAGYPQALHALVLYAALRLAFGTSFQGPSTNIGSRRLARLATGLLAGGIAVGLAAVQWLPTLELVAESIRAGGVEPAPAAAPALHLRGLLFTAAASVGPKAVVVPAAGSLTVVALALFGARAERSLLGHGLAALVLLQLAMADQSLLYRLLHPVLPGLDSFRITQVYGLVGLVGVAVLASAGAERLGSLTRPVPRAVWLQASLVLAFVALSSALLWVEGLPAQIVGIPSVALGVILLLLVREGAASREAGLRFAPLVCVASLVVEILWVRAPLQRFVDLEVLREPPPVAAWLQKRAVEARADASEERVANVPRFPGYLIGFANPDSPVLDHIVPLFLSSMEASSNLLFGVSSVNANLALELERRALVEPIIHAEVRGHSERAPGRRFIDLLGVRWVIAHKAARSGPYAPDLREAFRDEQRDFTVLENPSAGARLRLIGGDEVKRVADLRAAVDALSEAGDRGGSILILESQTLPGDGARPLGDASLAVVQSSTHRYTADVSLAEPAWLFVADAPYPGWRALVDGEPAPVLAANVLGKAVPVPAGAHRVEVLFDPSPFRTGLLVSAASGIAALLLAWWAVRARVRSIRDRLGLLERESHGAIPLQGVQSREGPRPAGRKPSGAAMP